jgi:hypothetical protein
MRIVPAILAAVSALAITAAPAQRFFPDDPLAKEPESQDASAAKPADVGLFYDIAFDLFATSRREPSNTRAGNVNTIDEVPDSSWFTNRVLARPLVLEEIVRGPNTGAPPNAERWVLLREKSAGASAGFTARDANGETWFLSFDTQGHEEGATGAMVVASKIFWALGYNQVETFITKVDPRTLTIDPSAMARRPNGKKTPFRQSDLDAVLERAPKSPDGTYRAAAGRFLPGKVLGPFRYEGTRPDDPNDVVDHEHRRELRALRVFAAWTNLTDLKSGNTLDTLVTVDGRSVVRHYLQDVGSTFGIGANGPHDWEEGFEYLYQGVASRKRLLTLGLARSPWQKAEYPDYPSVGRFESEQFDPVTWKPRAPTTGYMEMQPDDAFWAARRVLAFDDAMLRTIARTGQYSDPAAEAYLAATLAKRRDKVARAYLAAVNPIVNPRLGAGGELTFENAAVAAGVVPPPAGYQSEWAQFDNASGETRPLGRARGNRAVLDAPEALPSAAGDIVQIDVWSEGAGAAAQPIRMHFRRSGGGWTLIGLDRRVASERSVGTRAPERPRR